MLGVKQIFVYINDEKHILFTYSNLTTTDTSAHVIETISPTDDYTSTYKFNINAFGNGEWGSWEYTLVVTKSSSANPVIQLANEDVSKDSFGWLNKAITFSVNGSNIDVIVKSDNAVSIDWNCRYEKI